MANLDFSGQEVLSLISESAQWQWEPRGRRNIQWSCVLVSVFMLEHGPSHMPRYHVISEILLAKALSLGLQSDFGSFFFFFFWILESQCL